MAELKLDEELSDLIDDIIADSKLSEEEFELLKDEFAERDLDIKDYLNDLDAVFQQRLADSGKNIVNFNIYWKAYRFKFEKNINTDKLTEDNLSVVFDKDFEDLLNATIMDGKIDKNEMSALAAECQKNNLSLQDLGVLLEERLELIDSSKLERFRISWKARLDEYQKENNNAAQTQPEPAKLASSPVAETTAVTPTAETTHAVPQASSQDDDFRRKKKNNSEPKNEEKFEFNTESAKKVVKKIGVTKIALVAVCLIVVIFIIVKLIPNVQQQVENDTQVTGPNKIASTAKIDESKALKAALDKINNSENGWGDELEKLINDPKTPNDIVSIAVDFDEMTDKFFSSTDDDIPYFYRYAEKYMNNGGKIRTYLQKQGVGEMKALQYSKVIPYWCIYKINAKRYMDMECNTATFFKYIENYVDSQGSIDRKDINVLCLYFYSSIYDTTQGAVGATFTGVDKKIIAKLKGVNENIKHYRNRFSNEIGDDGSQRSAVVWLDQLQAYLEKRINGNRWQQGDMIDFYPEYTY